jgi:hypothetical protein
VLNKIKKIPALFLKTLGILLLGLFTYALINSSLDIYNNFAYDRAITKYTPYGYMPLLTNPNDYHSEVASIRGGDFVYVEDWTSAVNGRVVFAKVKSKLNSGYMNQDLLVETNINIRPIISVILLCFLVIFTFKKFYHKYSNKFSH